MSVEDDVMADAEVDAAVALVEAHDRAWKTLPDDLLEELGSVSKLKGVEAVVRAVVQRCFDLHIEQVSELSTVGVER